MTTVVWVVGGIVAIGLATWLLGFAAAGLRTVPVEPKKLAWASPQMTVEHADLNGVKVRYVKAGKGPNLVLLHTLRTQLDIYQSMIPELQETFTVYALDYPGHGWSDIPDVRYVPEDFYGWAEAFLKAAEIDNAIVAGTSIGGTIALELAARQNPRVAKAISINPYDYPITYTSGLKGSSMVAALVHSAIEIPIVGETFMRLRMPWMERMVFEGGLVDNRTLSNALFDEMSAVGNRPGQLKGFISLLRESQKWQAARDTYNNIKVPVLLVYSDQDWAPQVDRERTASLIPNVEVVTVENAGHFLPLDEPKELARLIREFADRED